MTKKKIVGLVGALLACFGIYYAHPLAVNWIQSKIDSGKVDRAKVVHLWNTLHEVGEIADPENKGADSELIIALRTISEVEKNIHPKLWEKHVKGTENNYEQFLNKVEVVVKINHRATYDLVALREGAQEIVAKADVNESWKPSELPLELSGVAHELAAKNADSENVPLLPYAMIEQWNYQRSGKVTKSTFPSIDLSNPQTQAILAEIAQDKGSKQLAQLAAEKKGILIPTFGKNPQFQSCFKYEYGVVEIDAKNDSCKTLAQKYFETAKASAELSRRTTNECKADRIRLTDSSMDIDPCADPGTFTANTMCDGSIAAYIRKLTRDPKSKDETHKKFLLENCQEEIKVVPKDHRHLFE